MDEVSIEINAPADRLYGMIAEITRMGEWSPECTRCEWLDGATAPAVGARFKGWNKRGLMRWSTRSKVTAAEPGREFAWQVEQSGMEWGYRFEPAGAATRVVEYRKAVRDKPWWVKAAYGMRLMGKDPDGVVTSGMHQTLQRIKAAAES